MAQKNLGTSSEIKNQLKKYYVYALIDPRDVSENGILYIGKGKDTRGQAHATKALSFKELTKTVEDNDRQSEKHKKIQEIYKATNEKPIVRVIGRFDTNEEAFAVEAVLIQYCYGLTRSGGSLTNIVLGHNSRHFRHKGDFELTSRLDIPKVNRIVGEYSKSEVDKLISNNIPEIAEETVEQLRALIASDPDLKNKIQIDNPQFVESGRYVGAVVNFGEDDVIMRLQFRSTKMVTNLRARKESTQQGKQLFSARMKELDLEIKNKGAYGWMPNWSGQSLKFTDYSTVILRMKELLKKFGK